MGFAAVSLIVGVAGCRSSKPIGTLPPVAPPVSRHESGPLDDLAKSVERASPEDLDRVSFTPGQAELVLKRLGQIPSQAARVKPNPDGYAIYGPQEVNPNHRGLRLISRSYAWTINAAAEKGDWAVAAQACINAHRFAAVMCAGDAADASIGLAGASEARAAISRRLPQMPPQALNLLADGVSSVLAEMPKVDVTLDHEATRAQMSVQHLQDLVVAGNMEQVCFELGRTAKNGIASLEHLNGDNAAGFFQGLASEANQAASWYTDLAGEPAASRPKEPEYGAGERPWRHLSPSMFQPMASHLAMRDIFEARARLLVLTARIEGIVKSSGKAPSGLGGFSASLRRDPYSGEDFRYRAAVEEYRIYSVGEDGADSGGDTDDGGFTPDLVLDP